MIHNQCGSFFLFIFLLYFILTLTTASAHTAPRLSVSLSAAISRHVIGKEITDNNVTLLGPLLNAATQLVCHDSHWK